MNIAKIHTTILRKAKERCVPFLHGRSHPKENSGQVSGNGTGPAHAEADRNGNDADPSRLVDAADPAAEVRLESPPPQFALVKRGSEPFALVPIDAEIVRESSGNGNGVSEGSDQNTAIGMGASTKVNGESKAPDSVWAGQLLEAARRAAGCAEAALKEEVSRRDKIEKRLQQELAELRKERDELRRKLGPGDSVASDFKRRFEELENKSRKTQEELDRVRADIEKRTRAEFDLRAQLETAKEAADYSEAALKDAVTVRTELEHRLEELKDALNREHGEQSRRLEEQIASLRGTAEELERAVAAEREKCAACAGRAEAFEEQLRRKVAEAQKLKVDLEQRETELERSRSTWKEQLDTAIFSRREVEGEFESAVERTKRLEQQLANLQRENTEVIGKLTAQDRAVGELQDELKTVKADRERTESALREEISTAQSAKAQVEHTLGESLDRNMRSDQELATLRQERDDLQAKLTSQQETANDLSRQIGDLHTHLAQSASELGRLKGDLETQAAERQAAETSWREQLDAAKDHAKKMELDWSEAVQRNVQFQEQLTKRQQECDEAATQMQAAQQAAAEATWRADDVERRLGRNAVELENLKTELAKLKAEKHRAEAGAREQLETQKALTKKLDAAWTAAVERNRGFEAEVACLREQCEELQAKLGTAKKVAESPDRAASLASLADSPGGTTEIPEPRPKKQASKRSAKSPKAARASQDAPPYAEPHVLPTPDKPDAGDSTTILPYNFADPDDDLASKRPLPRRRSK